MKNNFPNLKLVDHPLIKKDITLLRDKKTQPEYFRAAVRRISNILAVEIGMTLSLKKVNVDTPLERTKGYKLDQQIILIPVLRAGLSMVSGFLDVIPDCKVGHIGLQRNEETLEPVEYYFKIPNVDANSKIILLDPMLATGGSASQALKYLKKRGGKKIVFGFSGLVNGELGAKKHDAMKKAKEKGFRGA